MTLPLEVIDATGTELAITTPVGRVVSLVPSVTETIFAIGAGRSIVGRTRYCIHPSPEVRSIERIGGTKDPDVARIIELAPDLVLANREENIASHVQELRDAGIMVHVSEPRTPDDALALVAFLGLVFDQIENAAKVVYQGEVALHELAEAHREREALDALRMTPKGSVTACALVWREPWIVAGGDTYISGILSALGVRNVFGNQARYPRVSVEDIVRARPDLILLPSEPYEFGESDMVEMGELVERANEDGQGGGPLGRYTPRILLCNGEDLMWFGSRTPEALRRIRQVIA